MFLFLIFFYVVSSVLFSVPATAQGTQPQPFELKVRVPAGNPDSIWVMYYSGTSRYVKALLALKDGQLRVQDTLIEPIFITLRRPAHKDGAEVEVECYVEAGANTLTILSWEPLLAQYPENGTQQQYSSLQTMHRAVAHKYDSAILACSTTYATPDSNLQGWEAQKLIPIIDSLREAKWKAQAMQRKDFVEHNLTSWISIHQFYSLLDYYPIDELLLLFEQLPASLQSTPSGQSVEGMLTAIAQSRPGKALPAIEATDNVGKHFSSANFSGKGPVLFDFWASWCGPCIEDFPVVLALARQYATQGLKVVFVSIDGQDAAAWQDAMHKYGLSGFEHFLVDGNSIDTITRQLAVQGIPDKILIDSSGTIVYRKMGSGTDALVDVLKEIMESK